MVNANRKRLVLDTHERTMILCMLVLLFNTVNFSKTENAPCTFMPNNSLKCVRYMKDQDEKQGCLITEAVLEFTGNISYINGEIWLKIKPRGAEENGELFVRYSDGQCANQCCHEDLMKHTKRFGWHGKMFCNGKWDCCKNGGYFPHIFADTCVCLPGFSGKYCDLCSSNPCHNGFCIETPFSVDFTCICLGPYTGRTCNTHCRPNPCRYGTCSNTASGFRCSCRPGYRGVTCNKAIDHCKSNPCQFGTCSNSASGFKCSCNTGYSGRMCSKAQLPTVSMSSCIDSSLVNCTAPGLCNTTLKPYCPVTCGICIPAKSCVDNQFVKCSDPKVCATSFRSSCPVSCGICKPATTPATTPTPCTDSPLLNCGNAKICTTSLGASCKLSCGLCGKGNAATWNYLPGR